MTRVKPDEEFKNDLVIEQLLWEDFMEHLDRLIATALPSDRRLVDAVDFYDADFGKPRDKTVHVLKVGKLANT